MKKSNTDRPDQNDLFHKGNSGQPQILFEDNHLLAAFKLPGQTVQPEPGKPPSLEEQIKTLIKERDKKPGDVFLGVIHRLDMPVSGIVLFAKTSKALIRMNKLFHDHQVQKIYEAEVEHCPPKNQDTITHWLKRNDKLKLTKAYVHETPGADNAMLTYTVLKKNKNGCLLRIELHTGRKHQIRAQLSAIGCPIKGDIKYRATQPNSNRSINLCAVELSFLHPVKGERVEIRCGMKNEE